MNNVLQWISQKRIQIALSLLKGQHLASDAIIKFHSDIREFRLPAWSNIHEQSKFFNNIHEYKISLSEIKCTILPDYSYEDPKTNELVVVIRYLTDEKMRNFVAWAEQNITQGATN